MPDEPARAQSRSVSERTFGSDLALAGSVNREAGFPLILVADDEPGAPQTVGAALSADRCRVEYASSGREVIARLDGPPVDLVLCDVMMPGMTGFEVCRQMKAHPRWRYVPVVLLTALHGENDVELGLASGADEFLTKPFSVVALRARVRAMLRIREQYNQLSVEHPDPESLLRARRTQMVDEAGLSSREREVLDLLLLGRTYHDIGTVLQIAPRTAKFHQSNILKKLGAESRLDLSRIFL
jgi:DNA-binding NarL/FixJ family response regulator